MKKLKKLPKMIKMMNPQRLQRLPNLSKEKLLLILKLIKPMTKRVTVNLIALWYLLRK